MIPGMKAAAAERSTGGASDKLLSVAKAATAAHPPTDADVSRNAAMTIVQAHTRGRLARMRKMSNDAESASDEPMKPHASALVTLRRQSASATCPRSLTETLIHGEVKGPVSSGATTTSSGGSQQPAMLLDVD